MALNKICLPGVMPVEDLCLSHSFPPEGPHLGGHLVRDVVAVRLALPPLGDEVVLLVPVHVPVQLVSRRAGWLIEG